MIKANMQICFNGWKTNFNVPDYALTLNQFIYLVVLIAEYLVETASINYQVLSIHGVKELELLL